MARLPGRDSRGQAAVEIALVMPVIVLLLLAAVQAGLVVRDQVLVVHAAREAARESAVRPGVDAPRRAAVAGSGLNARRLSVRLTGRGAPGSRVRAVVRYDSPTRVPIVGPLLPDVRLAGVATMRVES